MGEANASGISPGISKDYGFWGNISLKVWDSEQKQLGLEKSGEETDRSI